MRVFVIGASSEIGLAVCKKYLAEGWAVLAHYCNNQAVLDQVAANAGGRFKTIRIVFEDPNSLDKKLSDVRSIYNDCDALINCAAMLDPLPFSRITAQNIMKHLAVNLVPGLLIMRDLGQGMKERGWGRVVHLGSIGTKFGGGQETFAYSLSKFALEMMPSETKDWAQSNVLVNTLRVGVTETNIHSLVSSKNMTKRISLIPMKRMAIASEIANTVWFLGSKENTFITGQCISISGGE